MILLSAVVLFGILIFVHELGHFLFAKLTKVKVLKFSLGFGPKLVGKQFGETEYLLSAIPLGGYVKMTGEDAGDEISEEDKERAFSVQPVWKRLVIVLSGPLFNILFAAFIFVVLFLTGVPALRPDVGEVAQGSPAARAGLMTGDKILAVDGTDVESWDDVEAVLHKSPGKALVLKLKRDGQILDISVVPEKKMEKTIFGESKEGWSTGLSPLVAPQVGEILKGSRAGKAGLQRGDRIVEIDGTALKTWQDMTKIIHANPERPLAFRIKRDGRLVDVTIAPEKSTQKTPDGRVEEIGLIGIKPLASDFIKKYAPIEAVRLGVERTWDMSVLTVVSIVKLIQRIIPAETIGGPIMIFQMAGEQASHGPMSFFVFMAVISINLGVVNLLPIPILDGGHILFFGIEMLRGKPLGEKTVMVAQRIGMAILVTLMVFAFYNDIMRFITGKMLP